MDVLVGVHGRWEGVGGGVQSTVDDNEWAVTTMMDRTATILFRQSSLQLLLLSGIIDVRTARLRVGKVGESDAAARVNSHCTEDNDSKKNCRSGLQAALNTRISECRRTAKQRTMLHTLTRGSTVEPRCYSPARAATRASSTPLERERGEDAPAAPAAPPSGPPACACGTQEAWGDGCGVGESEC